MWPSEGFAGPPAKPDPEHVAAHAEPTPPAPPLTPDRLEGLGAFVNVIAVLVGVGALIGGIALIAHTGQNCIANPYNDVFGTDLSDCTKTHPFAGTGAALLVGGLLEAVVFATVARLCHIVATLRTAPPTVKAANDKSSAPTPVPGEG